MTDCVIFGVLAVTLGVICLSDQPVWLRASCYVLLVCVQLIFWQVSLGRPRPQLWSLASGKVLAAQSQEPVAIYVWVLPDHSQEPISYALPWTKEGAMQLQKAQAQQKQQRGELRMAKATGGQKSTESDASSGGTFIVTQPFADDTKSADSGE